MKRAEVVDTPEVAQGSLWTYFSGFLLSIYLTITAYLMVAHHLLRSAALVATIVVLALLQLFVQLIFFLHLHKGSKARWNISIFAFMTIIVIILVFGTIWIMTNLNYHHQESPSAVNKYLNSQDGL